MQGEEEARRCRKGQIPTGQPAELASTAHEGNRGNHQGRDPHAQRRNRDCGYPLRAGE
jgi:hypothetical protein